VAYLKNKKKYIKNMFIIKTVFYNVLKNLISTIILKYNYK